MRILASALIVAAAAAAQPRPDFSGRWVLDSPAAATAGRGGRSAVAPGDMGSGWGSTITLAQSAGTLALEYVFFATYDLQPPLTFTFALDGRETTNTVMMGRGLQEETSTAAWEGAALVITTRYAIDGAAAGTPATFAVKRTLSLEGPDTLIVDTERAGAFGGPPSSTRAVYRRVPAGR